MFWRKKSPSRINKISQPLALLRGKMRKSSFDDPTGGKSTWSAGFIAGFTSYGIRGSASDSDDFQAVMKEIIEQYEAVIIALYDQPDIPLMLEKASPDNIASQAWKDGYGYGWRDAEYWAQEGAVTLAWVDHVHGLR